MRLGYSSLRSLSTKVFKQGETRFVHNAAINTFQPPVHRCAHTHTHGGSTVAARGGDGDISHLPSTMRAMVLTNVGKDFQLELEELRMPVPKHDEVLIKTKASDIELYLDTIQVS